MLKTVLKDLVQLDHKIQPPLQLFPSLSSTLEHPPIKSQRNAVNAHKFFFIYLFYFICFLWLLLDFEMFTLFQEEQKRNKKKMLCHYLLLCVHSGGSHWLLVTLRAQLVMLFEMSAGGWLVNCSPLTLLHQFLKRSIMCFNLSQWKQLAETSKNGDLVLKCKTIKHSWLT